MKIVQGENMTRKNVVYWGDNLPILKSMASNSASLVYIDPPFNTGKTQERTRVRTERSAEGDRNGFQGNRYKTTRIDRTSYADKFDDLVAFLTPRMIEAYRILTDNGTLYFHIDYREVHYCKIMLDNIFGRRCFLNEIIWAYDYGGKTKRKWPPKHNNILVYVKDPTDYTFNVNEIDRIPYMAPSLVGREKAARGKLPTDTWWHTIVPTNGKERTGYSTQKPLPILERIVRVSSKPKETVLDFFAGSGTTGEAAYILKRNFVLIDNNREAIDKMRQRFALFDNVEFITLDSDGDSDA